MIRTAVDTNVVVAALLSWHGHHVRSLAALGAASGSGHRLVLHHSVLVQSFSVLTRLPPGRRLAPRGALDLLRGSFRGRADIQGTASGEGWRLLEDGVSSGAIGGGIHDFEILTGAVQAGAQRLLTWNSEDFLRFGDRGVEIVSP